ncbi:hypothetical protein WJR50_27215, partial [Catalinimonas sp. 4WD22]|uniref:hypothetical protein n=1 Tax=Catalinimonas locisalis TaxID=3133978 RepID=UPI003100C988
MKRYLQNYKVVVVLFSIFILSSFQSFAQPQITGARIIDSRSNYLEVTFSENISASNAEGFRLVGGAARIKSLLGG